MNDTLYQVYAYPKDGYLNDDALQEKLTTRSKTVDRRVKILFIAFIVVFLLSIAMMFAGYPLFVFGCIGGGAALPLVALVYLPPPRYSCPTCGQKMKKEWELIDADTARYGEFLVCKSCRRYAYTHRASRS